MRALFAFVLFFAGARAGMAEVRLMESRSLEMPVREAPRATHALELHLYLFEGSPWRREAVVEAARGMALLIAQCGVATTGVTLTVLDAPPALRVYSTPVARQLLRELPVRKPAVFFVDDTRNRPAYDAETIGLANAAGRPELAHTIWVAYGARDPARVLAHELVHLLSDSGAHSAEAHNLMQPETAPENVRLTEAQCAQLRENGVAQRLLKTQ